MERKINMTLRVATLFFLMMQGVNAFAMQQGAQQGDADVMSACAKFAERCQRLNLQLNSPEYTVGDEQPFFCKFTMVKKLLEEGAKDVTTYYTKADDKKDYIGAYTPSFNFLEPLLEKRDGYDDFQMLAHVYSSHRGYELPAALATMYENYTANQAEEICYNACRNIQTLARETREQLLTPAAVAETKKQLQQTLDIIKPLSTVAPDLVYYEQALVRLITKQEWNINDYIAITERNLAYDAIIKHAQKHEQERKAADKALDETLEQAAEKSKERTKKLKQLEKQIDKLADKKQAAHTFARRMCIAIPILAVTLSAAWWYFSSSHEQSQEEARNA